MGVELQFFLLLRHAGELSYGIICFLTLRYCRLAAEVLAVIWHVMRSLTWPREVLRVAPAQDRVSYETLRYSAGTQWLGQWLFIALFLNQRPAYSI